MKSLEVPLLPLLVGFILWFPASSDLHAVTLSFRGVLDGRWVVTDSRTSWLDTGPGKLRYGGENNERRSLLRLSQVSGVLSVRLHESLSARVHVNLDPDPDQLGLRSTLDVIETFVSFHPVLPGSWRWRTKGGIFFPPVSLENRGPAWTTPYTITTSAINSWIGEEVRISGLETGLTYSGTQEVSFRGGIFANNDPAGSLLAWRGWALHDRQSGLRDRLPLPPIPAIQPDGLFPEQPAFVEPFREVDSRPGYYGSFSWKSNRHEFNMIHYDNRGNQTEFDGTQYAWETDFTNVGLALPIAERWEILGQFLFGNSRMGPGNMVNIHFYSWYAMISATIGKNRITTRFDAFRVQDRDSFVPMDNNNETGSAWTLAYIHRFSDRYRMAFEILRVDSSRPIRRILNLPIRVIEVKFQTGLRIMI